MEMKCVFWEFTTALERVKGLIFRILSIASIRDEPVCIFGKLPMPTDSMKVL
jgi:hypothetical protein